MWIGTCQEMVTKQPSPHFPLLCVLSDPPQANPEPRQNCLDKKEAGGYGGGSEGDAGGHEGDGGGGGGDDGGSGRGVPKEMTTLLSCVRVCCMIIRTAVVQAQTLKSL